MKRAAAGYLAFSLAVVFALMFAAIPIMASDLFRQPYSPIWPTVHRTLDLLRIDPYPTGGGSPPKFPYWRDPADASIYFRDVTLTTKDDVNLAAWYVPATDTDNPSNTPTILLAHGFLDRRWFMLHLVPWLHDAGYSVMVLDFRGHGDSDKQPSTLGRKEVLDLQAALDWLEAEGAAGRVGGLGMSMGAATLVNTAAQDDRIDALVLDSCFADWKDTDFGEDYRLPPEWLVPDVPSPQELIPLVHVPVFIIHGTADVLTNVDHAYHLYDAANDPKAIWINDSGHAWSSWTYTETYRRKVLDFFKSAFAENSH